LHFDVSADAGDSPVIRSNVHSFDTRSVSAEQRPTVIEKKFLLVQLDACRMLMGCLKQKFEAPDLPDRESRCLNLNNQRTKEETKHPRKYLTMQTPTSVRERDPSFTWL